MQTPPVQTPPPGWIWFAEHPRRRWPKEVADFVPWLAANIDLLGECVGRELTVVARERTLRADSASRADLVAQDADGAFVVVEAQLGRSDARHLGQLVAYAGAGRNISLVVWVVADMSDGPALHPDHARAVDLLNRGMAALGIRFAVVEAVVESDPHPPGTEREDVELFPRLRLIDLEAASLPSYDDRYFEDDNYYD